MNSGQPVVLAYEDSEDTDALRAAEWLARALGAPVILAHAFDPMGIASRPSADLAWADLTDQDLEEDARRRARRLLATVADSVHDVPVETRLPEGAPVSALLELVASSQARLLVTGTAARTGLDRILIGSVSSALALDAPCPVVAVPDGVSVGDSGPVLVGYDGSVQSERAARHGAALAGGLGRELVLVHASARDRELTPAHVPPDIEVRSVSERGDPVEVLTRSGDDLSAALTVVGTRGRGALSEAILGSVTVGLVARAKRPVVIVPEGAG